MRRLTIRSATEHLVMIERLFFALSVGVILGMPTEYMNITYAHICLFPEITIKYVLLYMSVCV